MTYERYCTSNILQEQQGYRDDSIDDNAISEDIEGGTSEGSAYISRANSTAPHTEAELVSSSSNVSPPAESTELHRCRWLNEDGNECGMELSSYEDITSHISQMHVTGNLMCMWAGCERNGKPFQKKRWMLQHVRTHTGHKPFQCPDCPKKFTTSSTFITHKKLHTGEKPYKCSICDKSFSYSTYLKIHLRIHNGEKPFKCDECEKSFAASAHRKSHQMRRHRKTTQLQGPSSLPINSLPSSAQNDIRQSTSLNSSTPSAFQVMESEQFDVWGDLEEQQEDRRVIIGDMTISDDIEDQLSEGHSIVDLDLVAQQNGSIPTDETKSDESTGLHRCRWLNEEGNECGMEFSSDADITSHISQIHVSDGLLCMWASCERNGRPLQNRSKISEHLRVHTGYRPFQCPNCPKKFKNISYLKEHKLLHTGEKRYKCSECDKSFAQYAGLKHHHIAFHGEGLKCRQCSKSFASVNSLKEHQRIHTGERKYKCSECDESFTQYISLKNHHAACHGEGLKCGQCSKSFASANSLKAHQRIHTGEKPFKCNVCGKVFAYSSNLKLHQRTHSGQKPYTCETCGKSFSQSDARNTHQRTQHVSATRIQDLTSVSTRSLVLSGQEDIQRWIDHHSSAPTVASIIPKDN